MIIVTHMVQVNVSEFRAVCSRLLEQVRQTREPIEIRKNGKPLAVVFPPPQPARRSAFGALKHSLRGPAGELVTPVTTGDGDALDDDPDPGNGACLLRTL